MQHYSDLNDVWKGFAAYGEKPAVIAVQKDSVKTTSYNELWKDIQRVSSGLLLAGLEPGDRVIVQGDNSAQWVTVALSVIMAGGVIVPLDAQMPSENLNYIIRDSSAKWAFMHAKKDMHLHDKYPDTPIKTFHLDTDKNDPRSWMSLFSDAKGNFLEMHTEDVAVQFYTSGTTGNPKGVPLTHKNLLFEVNTLVEMNIQQKHDRLLNPLPFSHVFPFAACMLVALTVGVPIIIPYALTGPELVRGMQLGEATIVTGVPRLFRALYEGIINKAEKSGKTAFRVFNLLVGLNKFLIRTFGVNAGKTLLSSLHKKMSPDLRLLVSGGAALPEEIAKGLEGLGWEVSVGYGLTETSPLLTLNYGDKSKLESSGYPGKGIDLKIDPAGFEGMQTEGVVKGEVLAKGPNVFSGYHNLPEKNKEVFTEDGWFRTGDLGYFDKDGFLYLCGRASSLIVTEEGKNIDPEEVEEKFQRHHFIEEVAVMEREGKLVAVIVPNLIEVRQKAYGDIERAVDIAIKEVSEHIPTYYIPDNFLISREPLPKTRLGKTRRHKLPEFYNKLQNSQGERADLSGTPMKIEEMSESDQDLLDDSKAKNVWNWLCSEYSDKNLTPDTNIQFDLGVDSIGWLGLTLEIRQQSGIELQEEVIARINTVRDLLKEVSQLEKLGAGALEAKPLEDPEGTLTEEQRRWLKPLGPIRNFLARGLFAFNRLIIKTLFGMTIIDQEKVPRNKQVALAPNHISHLDSAAIASNWNYDFLKDSFWAGWVGVTHGNFISRFISRLVGVVPIDPDRTVISNLAFGAAAIKQGKQLIWFPEGMISTTGELEKFRSGLGILTEKFELPIIPVVIEGTDIILPKHKWWPKRAPITIIYGDPVDPKTLAKEGEGDTVPERIVDGIKKRIIKMKDARK